MTIPAVKKENAGRAANRTVCRRFHCMPGRDGTMRDQYDREINYMRLSVTDRCNLRCRYCMPEEGVCKKTHEEMLTEDEMIAAVEAGIKEDEERAQQEAGQEV